MRLKGNLKISLCYHKKFQCYQLNHGNVLLKSAQSEFLFSGYDGVAALSFMKPSPKLIKWDAAAFYITQGQKGFALLCLELLPQLIKDKLNLYYCRPGEHFLVITDCAKD